MPIFKTFQRENASLYLWNMATFILSQSPVKLCFTEKQYLPGKKTECACQYHVDEQQIFLLCPFSSNANAI